MEATTNTAGSCPAGYMYVVDIQVGPTIIHFWAKKPAALKSIESPVMFPNMAYLYTSAIIGGHPRLYPVRKVMLAEDFVKTWGADVRLRTTAGWGGSARATLNIPLSTFPLHEPAKDNSAMRFEIRDQTLLNDKDIASYEDSELFAMIAQAEARIERLEKIKKKPNRLVAEINRLNAGIDTLVDVLNKRDAQTSMEA